jgi:chitodextrinase
VSITRPLKKLSEIPASVLALLLLAILLQGCTATTNGQNPDPPSGDQTAPTAPGSLTASATSGTQINLTWAASSDNVGVTGYRVERCSGASCASFAQVGTSATTTYADSGLSGSTSYTYRVRAADAAGNLSGYSNTASATTQSSGDTQAPSAPSALTAAASSNTQIGLTWTASTDNVGVTGYRVERCVGNGCVSFAQVASATAVGFGDNGLLPGTTYGYRVRATDASGNLSAYSNISYATTTGVGDTQAPTAPSNLIATAASSSQIGLSWIASSDNVGVTGYDIERCAGASCASFAQIGTTGGATTFTDSGLTGSTAFRYRVRASDAAGNLSAYSNIASATTSASSDTQAPTAPSSLTATASSSSQIGLSWMASTDNVGVTGYRIERCVGASCTTFAQIGTTTGVTTFADTGLAASTAYRYRVRAADAAGNLSAYSNIASATTGASTDTQAPTAPSGLTATASSSSQIGLSWMASTDNVGVTGYRIERCVGASCTTFAQIGTTTGATTFSDSGLTASTSYSYRVRATDAAGNLSGYSNVASATTNAAGDTQAPTAPSSLAATASSSTQIGLTWTASTDNVGVTGYRIERCSGASCSSFVQIGTTTGATTFGDGGLTAATSYSYRVRATDAAGNLSGYSNLASATTSSSGGGSITVSVSPKRGGLTTSQTLCPPTGGPACLSITATLTNDTANQGVTWSFASTGSTSGGGFSSTSSTSGNAVMFTAPSGAGVVTITATAVGDATASATATIGVTDLTGVTTYHNNLSRDGSNQQEYALTATNVHTSTFGKLFSCTVDGAVYAQPLWVSNVTIGGVKHNVLIVATMHNSIYAFDADSSPCVTLWHANLLDSAHGGTSGEVPAPSFGSGSLLGAGSGDIAPAVGILGTPVIEGSTKTIYAVTKSENTTTLAFFQRLHAIDLTTGAEKFSGPAQINSLIMVAGTGDGSSGGVVPFDAQHENQRPGLALVNGIVYVSWASHEDADPYHGWVLGFNAGNLALSNKFNSSPNGGRSGIWMSGGAPAADSSNNLYVMTGNGSFDADTGGSDYGSSYLKLSTASGLTVSDYFTPHDQATLSGSDQDVGAGGTALLFGQNLMVGAGKSGVFYVLNRSNMGHFNMSSDAAAVQTWTAGRAFSTPAFWNNTMYYFGVTFKSPGTLAGVAYDFNTSTGLFNTAPSSQTATGLGFPGATPSVSSSGSTNGIVWAIDSNPYCTPQSSACGPAVLHAYDANNLGTELWNSAQGSGNAAGFAVKFTVPTVANGKVYVGSRGNNTGGDDSSTSIPGQIDVYGLLPN